MSQRTGFCNGHLFEHVLRLTVAERHQRHKMVLRIGKLFLSLFDSCQSLVETMTAAPLPETDWEESWKDNYPPQEVGNSLVVLPYWLEDTYETHRKKVILDPGLTFGTGAHPSTQMVMEAMEETVREPPPTLETTFTG